MYDQSNLMGGRKPSYLTADFSIRTLSATCIGSVPVVWTKRRSYRRSCRRYNGGTTAVRTPTERRYNAGTTPVQWRPDRASSILKPYFVRTYVSYVGPHTGSCRSTHSAQPNNKVGRYQSTKHCAQADAYHGRGVERKLTWSENLSLFALRL